MSDDNTLHVVPLHTDTQKSQEMCVFKLEEELARARQGQYSEIIIIAKSVKTTDGFRTNWTGGITRDPFPFVGALQSMIYIIMRTMKIGAG